MIHVCDIAKAFDIPMLDVILLIEAIDSEILIQHLGQIFVKDGDKVIGLHFMFMDSVELDPSEEKSRVVDIFEKRPGVYYLYDGENLVYIGKTIQLPVRIAVHGLSNKQFDSYTFRPCSKDDMPRTEVYAISHHKPKYNKWNQSKKWMLKYCLKKSHDNEIAALVASQNQGELK